MQHVTVNSTVPAASQKTPNTVVMPVPGSTNVGTVVVSSGLNGQFVNSHMTSSMSHIIRPATATNTLAGVLPTNQQAQYVVKPEHQIRTSGVKGLAPTMVNNSISPAGRPAVAGAAASAVSVVRPATGPVQIVNVSNASRFSQATTPTTAKVLAPRIVQNAPIRIAPQQQSVVVQRPQQANIPMGIPMQRPPQNMSLPPGTVLMKNEQGHFIIVNSSQPGIVSTSAVVSTRPGLPTTAMPTAGAVSTIQPNLGTIIRNSTPLQFASPSQPPQLQVTSPAVMRAAGTTAQTRPAAQTVVHNNTLTRPAVSAAVPTVPASPAGLTPVGAAPTGLTPVVAQAGVVGASAIGAPVSQTQLEQVKKCKNFLATLIRLAANQPENTVKHVKDLVQKLIDAKIEPEEFTQKLQVELRSAPQPYLVPFLKKNLPMLRQSMVHNQLSIDGIRAPPINVLPGAMVVGTPAVPRMPVATTMVRTPGGVTVTRPLTPGTPAYQNMIRGQTVRPVVTQPTLVSTANYTGGYAVTPGATVNNRQPYVINKTLNVGNRKPSATAASMAKLGGAPMINQVRDPKRKYESLKEDDDINDVATMGGVNLSEESRNILASNMELVSGQLRTCKDEYFLVTQALTARINKIAHKHGLSDCPEQVANLISHATQERLRNIIEKLSVTAEHRLEIYKMDKNHVSTTQVRSQMKFIEELDRMEKKRHDDAEREVLLRAAKSRSKAEDPEQLKLKEKAKAMKQMEMDIAQHREANETALAAIGSYKKKRKVEPEPAQTSLSNSASGSSSRPLRQRIKRVNLRDLLFLMEQERETSKSALLYKTYLK